MFIEQGFDGKRDWWRYIVVTFLVFVGYNIGNLPLQMALWRATDIDPALDRSDLDEFMVNPDFGKFGIDSNLGLVLLLIMFVAAIAVFYFVFKLFHAREFKTLSRSQGTLDWGRIFFGFGLWLSFSLIFESIGYFMGPENYIFTFEVKKFLPLVLICLIILPLQTSFEELFFRGYLMQGLGTANVKKVGLVVLSCIITYLLYKLIGMDFLMGSEEALAGLSEEELSRKEILAGLGAGTTYLTILMALIAGLLKFINTDIDPGAAQNYKIVALLLTSILFGIVHGSNPEIEKFGFAIMMFYYISAGLFLGIMTLLDNRLELALGVHAATNFTGAVFVGYEGGAIQTDSLFTTSDLNPYVMTAGFFVMASLFLIIAKKRYKWGSFGALAEPLHETDENLALNHLLKNSADS